MNGRFSQGVLSVGALKNPVGKKLLPSDMQQSGRHDSTHKNE